MNKNLIKIFPIVLIICLIIDAINIFSTGSISNIMSILGSASTMIGVCSLSLLVFYVDLERNHSDLAKAGFASILLYVLFSVIYMITLKNGSFSVASTMHKLQSTAINIVHFLEYTTMLKLISKKISDPIGEKVQMGAFIANGVRYLLLLIMVWATIASESPIYKISSLVYDIFVLLVITFVIYQVIEESDSTGVVVQGQPQQPMPNNGFQQPQQNQQASGFSTTPKFRNPALEQQEAMIAAQNQAQMQQSQYFQPFDNTQANGMQQQATPQMMQQPTIQQPTMQQPTMQPLPQDPDMQYTGQPTNQPMNPNGMQ